MKTIKKKVLEAIGKVAEVEANVVSKEWPPVCAFYMYQPKRPDKKMEQKENEKD